MKCHNIPLLFGILLTIFSSSSTWWCDAAFQITKPLSASARSMHLHITPQPQRARVRSLARTAARTRTANAPETLSFTHMATSSSTVSTSLHMFDSMNQGGGLTRGEKAKNWKEVLERIKMVIVVTASQFSSGYITGYVLSVIWGFLRGRPTESALWGLEFGALPAIFVGCKTAARLLFNAKDNSVWNVTVRNIILSLYFGRNRGWLHMLRNAVVYGSATYYFVSKKMTRDMSMGSGVGGPPSAAMVELLKQMAVNQNGFAGSTGGVVGGPQPVNMAELLQRMNQTTGGSAIPPPSSATKDSSSPTKLDKESNALDVEWEVVDPADASDNEDKNA